MTFLQNILAFFGILTVCCGAPKVYRFAWPWKHDGYYCKVCDEPV